MQLLNPLMPAMFYTFLFGVASMISYEGSGGASQRSIERRLLYTRVLAWPIIIGLALGLYSFFPDEENPDCGVGGTPGAILALIASPMSVLGMVCIFSTLRNTFSKSGQVRLEWILILGGISVQIAAAAFASQFVDKEITNEAFFIGGTFTAATLSGALIGAIASEITNYRRARQASQIQITLSEEHIMELKAELKRVRLDFEGELNRVRIEAEDLKELLKSYRTMPGHAQIEQLELERKRARAEAEDWKRAAKEYRIKIEQLEKK